MNMLGISFIILYKNYSESVTVLWGRIGTLGKNFRYSSISK